MDLTGARWRKSTRSSGETNSECVEVALVGQAAAMRDSKNQDGPVLLVPAAAWQAFLGHI